MLSTLVVSIQHFAAPCSSGGGFFGLPTWYKYLEGEIVAGKCSPVIDITGDPAQAGLIVLALTEMLLMLGGMVAVGFVMYGGFRYITSQGEPENTKAALGTIINALIGVGITILASAVVRFVGTSLAK